MSRSVPEKFKNLGMIDWVSRSKFSVFSLEKYDDYQSNFVAADYQQITTSKPANKCLTAKQYCTSRLPANYHR